MDSTFSQSCRVLSQKHIRRWLPINKRICYVAPLSQNSKQHRLSNLGEESVQQLPNSSISVSHWSGPPDQSIHSENCTIYQSFPTKLVYCWMLFTCTKLKVKIWNKGLKISLTINLAVGCQFWMMMVSSCREMCQ